MRPSGPRASLGYLVRSTTTISPALRPAVRHPATSTSASTRLSNGTTKPRPGAIHLQPADDALVAARHHLHHAPFVAALGAALDARDDAIAVHRVASAPGGMNRSSPRCPSRDTNPTPLGRRVDGADDEVRPAGQAEEMPALPDQVAGRRRAP